MSGKKTGQSEEDAKKKAKEEKMAMNAEGKMAMNAEEKKKRRAAIFKATRNQSDSDTGFGAAPGFGAATGLEGATTIRTRVPTYPHLNTITGINEALKMEGVPQLTKRIDDARDAHAERWRQIYHDANLTEGEQRGLQSEFDVENECDPEDISELAQILGEVRLSGYESGDDMGKGMGGGGKMVGGNPLIHTINAFKRLSTWSAKAVISDCAKWFLRKILDAANKAVSAAIATSGWITEIASAVAVATGITDTVELSAMLLELLARLFEMAYDGIEDITLTLFVGGADTRTSEFAKAAVAKTKSVFQVAVEIISKLLAGGEDYVNVFNQYINGILTANRNVVELQLQRAKFTPDQFNSFLTDTSVVTKALLVAKVVTLVYSFSTITTIGSVMASVGINASILIANLLTGLAFGQPFKAAMFGSVFYQMLTPDNQGKLFDLINEGITYTKDGVVQFGKKFETQFLAIINKVDQKFAANFAPTTREEFAARLDQALLEPQRQYLKDLAVLVGDIEKTKQQITAVNSAAEHTHHMKEKEDDLARLKAELAEKEAGLLTLTLSTYGAMAKAAMDVAEAGFQEQLHSGVRGFGGKLSTQKRRSKSMLRKSALRKATLRKSMLRNRASRNRKPHKKIRTKRR